MTENTMAAPVAADSEGEGSKKKLMLIAGGTAAALVLGGAGYLLLSGGGGDDASYSLPVRKTKPVTSTATKTLKSNVPTTTTLPAASTVRLGRDPFAALYLVPVAAPPAATTPTTPTGTTTTGTSTGTTTPVAPAKAPVATTYPLKLTKVYGSGSELTAVFSVNGKTQLAKVGSVFGRTSELKMLSLQQGAKGVWIAVVQVGDADPVDLNMGASILVM